MSYESDLFNWVILPFLIFITRIDNVLLEHYELFFYQENHEKLY
jgi:hypothetical protein